MDVLDTFIKKYINMRYCFKFITPLSKDKVPRVTSQNLPYRKNHPTRSTNVSNFVQLFWRTFAINFAACWQAAKYALKRLNPCLLQPEDEKDEGAGRFKGCSLANAIFIAIQ